MIMRSGTRSSFFLFDGAAASNTQTNSCLCIQEALLGVCGRQYGVSEIEYGSAACKATAQSAIQYDNTA